LPNIYHLAHAECWNRQRHKAGYCPDAYEQDGFIHCCAREQLVGVASRYYKNSTDLILLLIDSERLSAELVYENTVGGEELFPHLYGPLNNDAIIASHSCSVTLSGDILPALDDLIAL